MMYVLAAGASDGRSIPASAWGSLGTFDGEVAGRRFNNADLGLFVFQYGLDLLDLDQWRPPTGTDFPGEAATAALANRDACRESANRFRTYRHHWGLSAGDGPDGYHDYAPANRVDGTAHLTATLASVAYRPGDVLDNVRSALAGRRSSPLGRYGLGSINEDRRWVGHDMVGIDAGAAVLALENVLVGGRVRAVFHALPCVRRGLERLGFRDAAAHRVGGWGGGLSGQVRSGQDSYRFLTSPLI
jgi:hypothetical protein